LLEPQEQVRLHRALRLGLRTASQLMVPRERLAGIDIRTPIAEVLTTVTTSPFSRLPVYRGDLDHVAGMLHIKDLVTGFVKGTHRRSLASLLRADRPRAPRHARRSAAGVPARAQESSGTGRRRCRQGHRADHPRGTWSRSFSAALPTSSRRRGGARHAAAARRRDDRIRDHHRAHPAERRLRRRGVRDRRRASARPIEARAEKGDRLAKRVQRVLRDTQLQDRYIATAQLGITLASLGLGMYGEHVMADGIYSALGRAGMPAWLASHGVASLVAVAILTYFHIVVGEMVPKSLALQQAERLACWITTPMLWTKNVLYPFVVTLNGLGNLLLKAIGVNRQAQNSEQYYTPEELQLIVQESEELGALRSESSQMLQELFEFGDLTAGQVMVPRVRIVGIPVGTRPDAIREILADPAHTRYPVFEKDLDHILGMVHIKDLLRLLLNRRAHRRLTGACGTRRSRDRGTRRRARP
jgi:CBS domain containing-hemolysin-like protein